MAFVYSLLASSRSYTTDTFLYFPLSYFHTGAALTHASAHHASSSPAQALRRDHHVFMPPSLVEEDHHHVRVNERNDSSCLVRLSFVLHSLSCALSFSSLVARLSRSRGTAVHDASATLARPLPISLCYLIFSPLILGEPILAAGTLATHRC
jgi:hypothetical protein